MYYERCHTFFQEEVTTEWGLELPLSNSSIFSFPECHPIAAYFFFPTFPFVLFSSIMCFRRHFLRKVLPIHFAFFRFTVCWMFLSSFIPYNTSSFLTCPVPLIFSTVSSTTFQNFQGISCLFFEASNFQHCIIKLCPKCSISRFSPLNISRKFKNIFTL